MIKKIVKHILIYIGLYKKKDILLLGTPNHSNIGDSEIVVAEKEFLKAHKLSFFEVTVNEYIEFKQQIINKKNRFRCVMLHGGGNIGDQYKREEEVRRDIISSFKDKRIIIFPQTIYFTDTESGKNELKKTIQIYNNHPDLTICIREKYSFEQYSHFFKKTILIPDIVLNETRREKQNNNNKVLFLLRNDPEKRICQKEIDKIKELLDICNIKYDISDMMCNTRIRKKNRKRKVTEKLSQISQYGLVITDRLHGMVFSYLMKTSCIALGNYNNKVKGTYEWISFDESIEFIDDIEKISIEDIKNKINMVPTEGIVDNKLYSELIKCIEEGDGK